MDNAPKSIYKYWQIKYMPSSKFIISMPGTDVDEPTIDFKSAQRAHNLESGFWSLFTGLEDAAYFEGFLCSIHFAAHDGIAYRLFDGNRGDNKPMIINLNIVLWR